MDVRDWFDTPENLRRNLFKGGIAEETLNVSFEAAVFKYLQIFVY